MNTKRPAVLGCYLGLLALAACGAPIVVDDADIVDINVTYTFIDGNSESSELSLVVGEYEDALLEKLIIGSKVGDVLKGTVPADTFFDGYDDNKVQNFPSLILKEVFGLENPTIGDKIENENLGEGIITDEGVDEDGYKFYVVDFNDPETYSDIQYEIEVINIQKQ